MTEITPANLETVLAHLPLFEDPDRKLYTLHPITWVEDGKRCMNIEPYEYIPEVWEFIEVAYKNNFLQPFDWPSWQTQAANHVNDPTLVESADLETITRLLTTHVRKNKFCAGHLAMVIDCGHVLGILRRVDVLHYLQCQAPP